VAAGALVPEGKMIEPGVLVAGVPAKVIRSLTLEEIERSKDGALHYVQNGVNFQEENIVSMDKAFTKNLL
jgi:carbonic anhydrase/acetyltransferase-like protein (isoleucine patch superfamily)